MSSESSPKKSKFSGIGRDVAIFAFGVGTGAFGMRTYLNETNQIRTDAEIEAVRKRLQQQASTQK
jgi:hypothetical protein